MRNRLAPGGMMTVETATTPTLTWDKKVQPLVGAYAFNQGNHWTVIVVSRKIDGRHDDHDFGDGTTPVRLRLPFRSARKITLHKLTGDPRASNIEKLTIAPQTQEIPPDRLVDGQLVIARGNRQRTRRLATGVNLLLRDREKLNRAALGNGTDAMKPAA